MAPRTQNDRVLQTCQPFVVATSWNRPHFDLEPFGVPIPEANQIDPTRLDSETFLTLLERLDALTFGPEGMPMPRWVFYDGSELPGGIMGFGRPAAQLSPAQREAMRVPPGYDGLVPFSMFIAIPMVPRGDWMAHNLASLNRVFAEEKLEGLASITKAFGLRVYRTRGLYGATQWDSLALIIHTKFGPLDLVTAYTPAHSEHMTLTYRVEVTDERLRAALGDPTVRLVRPDPDLWLGGEDVELARQLQDEIERGAHYIIADRPIHKDGHVRIPLAKGSRTPS